MMNTADLWPFAVAFLAALYTFTARVVAATWPHL